MAAGAGGVADGVLGGARLVGPDAGVGFMLHAVSSRLTACRKNI